MHNFVRQNPLIRLIFHAAEPMQAIRNSSTRVRHFPYKSMSYGIHWIKMSKLGPWDAGFFIWGKL